MESARTRNAVGKVSVAWQCVALKHHQRQDTAKNGIRPKPNTHICGGKSQPIFARSATRPFREKPAHARIGPPMVKQ